jgi:predicted ATPase
VTVDVDSPEALADSVPRPASSGSLEQGYDTPLRAEAHIVVVVGFAGAGGRKIVEVVASTFVAQAEAGRRDIAEEARRSHCLLDMVLEQGQRPPYAPSALLR